MIYKDKMVTYSEAKHNFRTYRLVRLLHSLRVIKDDELIRHEEYIYSTAMITMHIDWEKYKVHAGNEVIQF